MKCPHCNAELFSEEELVEGMGMVPDGVAWEIPPMPDYLARDPELTREAMLVRYRQWLAGLMAERIVNGMKL